MKKWLPIPVVSPLPSWSASAKSFVEFPTGPGWLQHWCGICPWARAMETNRNLTLGDIKEKSYPDFWIWNRKDCIWIRGKRKMLRYARDQFVQVPLSGRLHPSGHQGLCMLLLPYSLAHGISFLLCLTFFGILYFIPSFPIISLWCQVTSPKHN